MVEYIKRKTDRITPIGWSIFVLGLVVLLLPVAGIQYTKYVDEKSNQQLCGLLRITRNRVIQVQPKTDSLNEYLFELNRIYTQFRCDKIK